MQRNRKNIGFDATFLQIRVGYNYLTGQPIARSYVAAAWSLIDGYGRLRVQAILTGIRMTRI
jgi:hypothetical protein